MFVLLTIHSLHLAPNPIPQHTIVSTNLVVDMLERKEQLMGWRPAF